MRTRIAGSWLALVALLFSTPALAQQELTFTPFRADGFYQPVEKLGWTVRRTSGATGPSRFTYDIRKNSLEMLRSGTLNLSSAAATIETVVNDPSMIYVQLTPEGTPAPPAPVGAEPRRAPYASVAVTGDGVVASLYPPSVWTSYSPRERCPPNRITPSSE